MKEIKISWLQKIIFRLNPKKGFRKFSKDIGIDPSLYEEAHDVFSKAKEIEITPTNSSERGFIITLDRKVALFFYQDGDHFTYDGFEIGEYDKGDVTVFDHHQNG